MSGTRRPLEHVRVLAHEQYIAAPYCTMLLADYGAEVIKVERPGTGDPRREMGPFIDTNSGRYAWGFAEYNRNKKSVTLDLKDPADREKFERLAAASDVLVENFRPGVMDKLGVGWERLRQVNPRLVYCAISGFGQLEPYKGKYSNWPAFDIVVEAMSGFMHMIGFEDRPPVSAVYGLADLVAALVAVQGILAALLDREVTGEGQFVDISMLDAMIALNERALTIHSFTGQVPSRGPERLIGPRGTFRAKDGYLALNVPTDYIWHRLTYVIGREDLAHDPRCVSGPARAANLETVIRPAIEGWLQDKTRQEAMVLLNEAGVPVGPVQTAADVFACPHVAARGMLVELDDPGVTGKKLVGSPVKFSRAPAPSASRTPGLGEHNDLLDRILVDFKAEGAM